MAENVIVFLLVCCGKKVVNQTIYLVVVCRKLAYMRFKENLGVKLTKIIQHFVFYLHLTYWKHRCRNISNTHRIRHNRCSVQMFRSHSVVRRENLAISTQTSQITQSKPSTLTFTLRMLRQVVGAQCVAACLVNACYAVVGRAAGAPCGHVDATLNLLLVNVHYCLPCDRLRHLLLCVLANKTTISNYDVFLFRCSAALQKMCASPAATSGGVFRHFVPLL